MEPLYTTTALNSYKEYKRYSRCAGKFTQTILIFILLSAILIVCGIYLKYYFFIAFAVIWPTAVLVSVEIARKRIFKTNKITANATMTYEFFDTFFTVSHNHGSVKIEYEKLYKAIETKTNFYLMIAKNQGYVLVKENFPEGLDGFLRSVVPSKNEVKMIKLIVSDVDGTLLSKDEAVLDSRIMLSLQKLLDSEKKVAVASGRTYGSLCEIFKPLSDKLYFICCDGSTTILDGKVLYTRSIGIGDVMTVVNHPSYSDCGIIICTPKASYILRGDEEFSKEAYRQSLEKPQYISGLYGLNEPIIKLCIYSKDGKAKPIGFMPKSIRVSYQSGSWCEYVSAIANKGLAVSDLQMRLYLSKLDTLAMGDGTNDLEMMKKAKYAVSVSGACDQLKAVCNLHTDDAAAFLESIPMLK